MASYSPEQTEHDLKELSAILRPWHNGRESDSVEVQNLREHEYAVARRFTEGLISGVAPEQRLCLTVGHTAIEGFNFRRGSHGRRVNNPRVMLEPGEDLELTATRLATDNRLVEELYVGDLITKVALSQVAKTLTEDGELSLLGMARPRAAAPSV